ncbi:hypothetical protein DMENIID0001_094760 [Sergentomyia squamirostris]
MLLKPPIAPPDCLASFAAAFTSTKGKLERCAFWRRRFDSVRVGLEFGGKEGFWLFSEAVISSPSKESTSGCLPLNSLFVRQLVVLHRTTHT